MWQKVSVCSDRGSMLPLFLGLLALGTVLSLGASHICQSYIFRESAQDSADQLALWALQQNIKTVEQLGGKLSELNQKVTLTNFKLSDGKTYEVRVCGSLPGWLKFPGLNSTQTICAEAAAR